MLLSMTWFSAGLNAQVIEQYNPYAVHSVERSNPYYPKPARIIATNFIAITLNAVGDGLRDRAWNDYANTLRYPNDPNYIYNPNISRIGHMLVAGSILTTLTIPLGQGFNDFGDWFAYLASYTLMRAAIFDPVYNLTRGNELFYHGNSSYWDMILGKGNWGAKESFARGIIFTVAITIPIQEWYIGDRKKR